ncbi:MAG: hypothetical protein AAB368_13800, partial [bacterium]
MTGLIVGTTFYFQLETRDEAGNYSYSNIPSSLPRQDATPPSAISQLSAAVNPLNATLNPPELDTYGALGTTTCTLLTQLTTLIGGGGDNAVFLTWTAPADQNGSAQLIPRYVVNWQTSAFPPLLVAAELSAITTTAPEIVASTWTASRITAVVTGLTRRNPYVFAVRPKDGEGNVGAYVIVKSVTGRDGLAPTAITGISALPRAGGGAVNLSWVAPGDDGTSAGPAVASYAIIYATYPVATSGLQTGVTSWWAGNQGAPSALPLQTNRFLPVPQAPGQIETHVVTGLGNPTTLYYFVIGSSDAAGNFSALTLSTAASAGRVSVDVSSPAAVTNLIGLRDALVKSTINLSWTAPADDPPSDAFSYAVKWATNPAASTSGWWSGP